MENRFLSQAGFLQFEIEFGNPEANLEKIKRLIKELQPKPDSMVALPELWAYGFDYDHADAHAKKTPFLIQQLAELASKFNIILAGSLLECSEIGEKIIYNSLIFTGPDGPIGTYRKQHLLALWQEEQHFTPGNNFTPVSTQLGTFGGLVCYDLRFPEISRAQAYQGAQIIVVSAEWPKIRINHWKALLRARAIENQVFILACNSCGQTGKNTMGGHSMLIGPDGTTLLEATEHETAELTDIDATNLTSIRSMFCPAGERPRPVRDHAKRVTLTELLKKVNTIRQQKSRIAFTNGCFDILHSGHVSYLEQARSTADCLVVGLNSDRSVSAIKGPDRPVNNEHDRARVLSSLACVDYVVIFDEETPSDLINAVLPDVLIKGADWSEENIVGAKEVKKAGGKVVRVTFEHNVSTSALISRIQSGE